MTTLSELAREMQAAGPVIRAGLVEAFRDEGKDFERKWRETATITAGRHGIHYPASIESHAVPTGGGVVLDVGPNPGKPQGGMSFEYGSRNQRPHLDGYRHLRATEAAIARVSLRAVDRSIP